MSNNSADEFKLLLEGDMADLGELPTEEDPEMMLSEEDDADLDALKKDIASDLADAIVDAMGTLNGDKPSEDDLDKVDQVLADDEKPSEGGDDEAPASSDDMPADDSEESDEMYDDMGNDVEDDSPMSQEELQDTVADLMDRVEELESGGDAPLEEGEDDSEDDDMPADDEAPADDDSEEEKKKDDEMNEEDDCYDDEEMGAY